MSAPRLTVALGAVTDVGKLRDHNEDAWGVELACGVLVVADGMGGLSGGEVASRRVVDTVLAVARQGRSAVEGIVEAHRQIRDASLVPGQDRMGSTALAAEIDRDLATVSWVGDSRAYLWRDGALRLLTRDHSFVNALLDIGAIQADEAAHHPNRNVLTRAVGIRDLETLPVDTLDIPLHPGDRLLLCTDGLHGYLPETAIAQHLAATADAQAMADALIAATLRDTEAGDNLTVLCLVVEQRHDA